MTLAVAKNNKIMKKLNKYLISKISLTLAETLAFVFFGAAFIYYTIMLILAIVSFVQYF